MEMGMEERPQARSEEGPSNGSQEKVEAAFSQFLELFATIPYDELTDDQKMIADQIQRHISKSRGPTIH